VTEPLQRLDVLIGRWQTAGRTTDGADRIEAVDTYERLPGGALLHLVDAQVGDQQVEGDGGALVWAMRGERDRFTGIFDDAREVIAGRWEALDEDSSWRPWMDITLTRER
jgi:hypothetical protein